MARYFYIGQKVWRNPDNVSGKVLNIDLEKDVNWQLSIVWADDTSCFESYTLDGKEHCTHSLIVVSQKPIEPVKNLDLGDWEIGNKIAIRTIGGFVIKTIKGFQFHSRLAIITEEDSGYYYASQVLRISLSFIEGETVLVMSKLNRTSCQYAVYSHYENDQHFVKLGNGDIVAVESVCKVI